MTADASDNANSCLYGAFISYRHVEPDRAWAKWLHAALETYRVPPRLVKEQGIAQRVGRVFRDDEELQATANLSTAISAALRQSRFLVVVCSRNTPKSQWVNEEVLRFRHLGGGDRILALLIDGEPHESFPCALCEIRRIERDAQGRRVPRIEEVEPLAADVRSLPEHQENPQYLKRMARLRLLACILGCRFDDLRRREQERHARRMLLATGLALVLAAVLALLSGIAVYQKVEADRQRELARQSEQEALQALYYSNISLAQRYLEEGNADLADDRLARCPAEFRHWEWTFLKGLVERGQHTILPEVEEGRVAISPDGRWVAVGTELGNLALWDETAGREVLRREAAHAGRITALVFSPDSRRLATAGEDKTARLWSVRDGKLLAELQGHTAELTKGLAFSPAGDRLATASLDQTVRLWQVPGGKPLEVLQIKALPKDLAWPGTRDQLLVLQDDGQQSSVVSWNVRTGKPLAAVVPGGKSHRRNIEKDGGLACNADGSLVCVVGNAMFTVWRLREGEPQTIFSQHVPAIRDAAFSGDGKTLAVHSTIGLPGVLVFDLPAQRCVYQVPYSTAAALCADGERMVVSRRLRLRAAPGTKKNVWTRILPTRVQWESPLPNSAGDPPPDLPGLSQTPPMNTPAGILDVARGKKLFDPGCRLSADRQCCISYTGPSGLVRTCDPASGAALRQFTAIPKVVQFDRRADITADGSLLVLVAAKSDRLHVFDMRDGRELAAAAAEGEVRQLRFAPDGEVVVALCTASGGGARLQLWWWRTGQQQTHSNVERDIANGGRLAFSPDGRHLATAGGQGSPTVHVWSWPEVRLLHTLAGHASTVTWLSFSSDGKRLVSSNADGTVRLWDPLRGQEILALESPERTQQHWAAFTPDDRAVVSEDLGGQLRVWGGWLATLSAGKPADLLPCLRRLAAGETPAADPAEAVHLASSTNIARLPISLATAGSYRLQARFTRTRGGNTKTLGFLLPAGQGRTMLSLDFWATGKSGLEQVDHRGVGRKKDPNPTDCPVTLVDGQSYTLQARVELSANRAMVTVQLDGREIIRWQGPQTALSVQMDWELPDRRMLGLVLRDAEVSLEQLQLTPLDESTYWLEPPP